MNIADFVARFERAFPPARRGQPSWWHDTKLLRRLFDPCPGVDGMASVRKLKLLNMAFGCLGEHECYVEIGVYQGKSLIAALLGNSPRRAFACDNFSEFASASSIERFKANLRTYQLEDRVTFYDADFRTILNKDRIPLPVGLYFYDGAHDEASQYVAIRDAEPLLADEALVLVDDWRLAADSGSHAKAGTERALAASSNEWKLLYELPARYNGDRALWWNGVGVLSFRRVPAR